jgi:hypothetical protein
MEIDADINPVRTVRDGSSDIAWAGHDNKTVSSRKGMCTDMTNLSVELTEMTYSADIYGMHLLVASMVDDRDC